MSTTVQAPQTRRVRREVNFTECGSWAAEAVCRERDPEAYFPERGGTIRQALAACNGCPVKTQCLADAVANNISSGVWGGTTERQRRSLLRANPNLPTILAQEAARAEAERRLKAVKAA